MAKKEEKKKNKQEDEEDLEELIEENSKDNKESQQPLQISPDSFTFQKFLQSPQSNSPVLEPVNEAPVGPQFVRLEQNIGPLSNGSNDNDSFNYATNPEEQEQRKYTDSTSMSQDPQRLDINKIGRQQFTRPQEVGLVQSDELKGIESDTSMKYIQSEKIDPTQAGKQNPFESNLREVERKKSDYVLK